MGLKLRFARYGEDMDDLETSRARVRGGDATVLVSSYKRGRSKNIHVEVGVSYIPLFENEEIAVRVKSVRYYFEASRQHNTFDLFFRFHV